MKKIGKREKEEEVHVLAPFFEQGGATGVKNFSDGITGRNVIGPRALAPHDDVP